jgi:ribonuclease J
MTPSKRIAVNRHSSTRKRASKTSRKLPRRRGTMIPKSKEADIIPPIGESIRIIPLGGVEEVGKNMLVLHYKDDIIVSDCGFSFVTEENAPGIDYTLPNTKYLEEHKDLIRGVIITHGHLDHIGGIPFIMNRIGNPPIYTRKLTSIMIKKRQTEFPHLPALDIRIVEPGEKLTLGKLPVKFFEVTHSIPDAMGVSVTTPYGNLVISGDLKLDHKDGVASEREERVWGGIGADNNLLFFADSTNVDREGFSIPEKTVHVNLEELIKTIPGRIILGTFASQFERMIKLVEIAEKHGRKVVTEGRSIKTNIEVAKLAGLLDSKSDTVIPIEEIKDYPPEKLLVLATGAQGEEFAALMRISNGQHRHIKLTKRDTIILSSSVIPGNEVSVQKLKDNLYRHGVDIIHYRVSDVHSTGHGNAGELAWINKKVKAKYFIPGYGFYSMLKLHADVARNLAGMREENIVIPEGNGAIIEIQDEGKKITTLVERAPSNVVMVDGLAIGDIQEVVMRDRKLLAQDGIFVIIATLNLKTGKLKKSPDIISRGFVYIRESQELFEQTRLLIKKNIEDTTANMNPIDINYVKNVLTDTVEIFLFQKTNKRPIVIPVLIGV